MIFFITYLLFTVRHSLIIFIFSLLIASGLSAQGIPEVPLDSLGKSLAKRGFRKAWPYVRHAVTRKDAWQIGVSMQGYASKHYGRRLFRNTISGDFYGNWTSDPWAPGGGFDVYARFYFPPLKSGAQLFIEPAAQLSYSRGHIQLGRTVVDGKTTYVVTGYDSNIVLGFPFMLGLNMNVRNVPLTFLVGWERYYLPDRLNGTINLVTATKGANLLFETGVQFSRINFLESLTVLYKVHNQYYGGRKNFIGLRLRLSILRS